MLKIRTKVTLHQKNPPERRVKEALWVPLVEGQFHVGEQTPRGPTYVRLWRVSLRQQPVHNHPLCGVETSKCEEAAKCGRKHHMVEQGQEELHPEDLGSNPQT